MKKRILLFSIFLYSLNSIGQGMDNTKLGAIIENVSDTIAGQNGNWRFSIQNRLFICLTDENNNRMRIISPVVEFEKLSEEEMLNALVANFHSALDVKYAISDNVLWTVFIHPLQELTEAQLVDAISQVYYAAETYGTTYSSTDLVFPGRNPQEKSEKQKAKIIKLQKG